MLKNSSTSRLPFSKRRWFWEPKPAGNRLTNAPVRSPWQLSTHLFGSGTGEEASRGLSHSLLNACIPQPVSQLFTDNIGLLCTRKVRGSLLDWAEKQLLWHVPANPQLLCFFSSLDHSLIQQSTKKLVPWGGCPVLLIRPQSGSEYWNQITQDILVPLSPSMAAIRRNVQNHCHSLQAVSGFSTAAKGTNPSLGTCRSWGRWSCLFCQPTHPAQHPPQSFSCTLHKAHKPPRELPETQLLLTTPQHFKLGMLS